MKNPIQQSGIKTNRSMPPSTVIPVLAYADVRKAVDWLCQSFGFEERLQIDNHRAQLILGDGSLNVTHRSIDQDTSISTISNPDRQAFITPGISIMVRVVDIDAHFEHVKLSGARIINPPTDYPYGGRQYTVEDLGSYHWTFSQTIADIDPSTWGGSMVE